MIYFIPITIIKYTNFANIGPGNVRGVEAPNHYLNQSLDNDNDKKQQLGLMSKIKVGPTKK